MTLSPSTQKTLTNYLLSLNSHQKSQQQARQTFSFNTYFQFSTIFARMDKFNKGYLIPSDFTQFMIQNKIVPNDQELYLVFRDFDRKRTGRVSLDDFKEEMMVRENTRLKKEVMARKQYQGKTRLDEMLEFQLAKYFERKIEGFKERTRISDKLINASDFSMQKAFALLSENQNTIKHFDSIDKLLRKNGTSLKNQDLRRIFSSLTFNKQLPLDLTSFESHIDPFKYGLYSGYKIQLAYKIDQHNQYVQVIHAQNLLRQQSYLNRLEMNRLYDEYNLIRDHNLSRSRMIIDQSRQRMICEEQKIDNMRMSRQIERESLEIQHLGRWRTRLLEEETLMRSRRLYDYF